MVHITTLGGDSANDVNNHLKRNQFGTSQNIFH